MKSASFPSIQVDEQLRKEAEQYLIDGESIESFLELAIRETVGRRRSQQERAVQEHKAVTAPYTPADQMLEQLNQMLASVKAASATKPPLY